MNRHLRKLIGVIGIGLSWSPLWGAFFAAAVLIIGIVRPDDIDPGESPVVAIGVGLLVGFVSGAIYGIILSFAENRKSIFELSLIRVALWGMAASAVWPCHHCGQQYGFYPLSPRGSVRSASVVLARKAELEQPKPEILRLIGRFLAKPLQAACSWNG